MSFRRKKETEMRRKLMEITNPDHYLNSNVQIYPISRGKFGHYNLLGFSLSAHPFVTKICNSLPLRIAVQIKKDPRSNHSLVEEIFMQASQIRPKLP